ncbi:MAG: T9SS type A sorting domain-containing protein [Bacteroidetes bacterium]|nr:T9SS type A sorting domain-containing protein [Bacteroidota bacterium]
MKQIVLYALLMLTAIPLYAQEEWSHSDSEPGITIMKGYSYVRMTIPDNRGGMWFINQNSYNTTDTIFVVHVHSTSEFRSPRNLSVTKIAGRSGAGGSNGVHATAVSDGNGGIVLFYFRENGVLTAQRFNILGQPQWGIDGVSISSSNFIGRYIFAVYSKGNFYVGWQNYMAEVISSIQVQRLNANGIVQWTQAGVSMVQNNTAQYNSDLHIARDESGGVALSAVRNDSLVWQYIDSTGNRKFPTGLFLDVTPQGYTSTMVYSNINDAWYLATVANRYGSNSGGDIILHKVQRISNIFIAQWSADTGKIICKYPAHQQKPLLTADAEGGMLISWLDNRNVVLQGGTPQIFAQRWTKDDKPQWNANGLQVTNNYFSPEIEQRQPILHKNGFILPLYETSTGMYLQKLNMNGVPQWYSPVGKVHSLKNVTHWNMFDVNGNSVLFAYWDGVLNEVNIKLMDGNGYLGDNAPQLDRSSDVINDQGGKISVLFKDSWQELNASANQQGGSRTYRLYRGITDRNGTARISGPGSGAVHQWNTLASIDGAAITTASGQTIYWELINDIAPHGLGTYSKIVSTTSDSGRQGIPWQYIMVGYGNFTSSPLVAWYSNIDSGYSVDNLPPYPPQAATGSMVSGAVELHWKKNFEADFAEYEIYRSTAAGFIPNEQNLLAKTVDTLYRDNTAPSNTAQYYIIKAVDVNGNRSDNSAQISLNVLEVSNANIPLPTEYALDQNYPNPFNPSTNISFALPAAGMVTISVTDALGREAGVLVQGYREAGRYSIPFSASHLASGVYFCEIRAEKYSKRIKMNLIK